MGHLIGWLFFAGMCFFAAVAGVRAADGRWLRAWLAIAAAFGCLLLAVSL